MPNRLGAPMPMAVAVDQAHFLHQSIGRHFGPALGDFGIVKRKIAQLLLAVPPRQFADLGGADPTIAIVDHDVGTGPISRAGQRRLGLSHNGVFTRKNVGQAQGLQSLGLNGEITVIVAIVLTG